MSQQNSMKNDSTLVEMFLGDSRTGSVSCCLRSERRFRSRKRRKTLRAREGFSTTRQEAEYELVMYIDEGYCDKEEGYKMLSEVDK